MDSNNFTASAIAAVVCLHNANAELKGTPKIGVTDVYVVWNCKTLQNNKALLATTVPDGMYYEPTTATRRNCIWMPTRRSRTCASRTRAKRGTPHRWGRRW